MVEVLRGEMSQYVSFELYVHASGMSSNTILRLIFLRSLV